MFSAKPLLHLIAVIWLMYIESLAITIQDNVVRRDFAKFVNNYSICNIAKPQIRKDESTTSKALSKI